MIYWQIKLVCYNTTFQNIDYRDKRKRMNTIEVTSPFDARVVGTVPFSSIEGVESAIELASSTFLDHNKALPKYKRIEILEKVMEIMSSQIQELTLLCASEGGK